MKKNELIQAITDSFQGVTLEDGIGLWQAQAIDDYETIETQQQARLKDEKLDWRKISSKDLRYCDSSLSFFDAKGMRFHLPAFMLAELNEQAGDGIIFHLSQMASHEKFNLLNAKQKYSIVFFLEWCLNQEIYEYDAPQIKRALDTVWKSA